MGLTPKVQRFVDEYLVDLNATQAAIRAGYSAKSADKQAYKLLQRADVKASVKAGMDARAEKAGITQQMVLDDLLHVAALAMGKEKLRKTLVGEEGAADVDVFEPNLNAANKALELLGKHLGMFKELVEHSADEGLREAIMSGRQRALNGKRLRHEARAAEPVN